MKDLSSHKNKTVVANALLALGFMVLTFLIHWFFIIPAVILSGMNYKILMSK